MQTVKPLLRKADESKQDAFLALLEFCNTPISGMEDSPAELLTSRKLRTRLPTFKSLLEPQARSTSQVHHKLLSRQQSQKAFYDRGTRPLSTLHEGELVRMRRGWEWTPAVVVKQHQAPRSYIVATPNGTQIRRNRIHLLPTKEEAPPVTNQAWEPASGASIPVTSSNTDMGIETYTGSRTTGRYPGARHSTSRTTCQKEPPGSTSARAPYSNCLDIFAY